MFPARRGMTLIELPFVLAFLFLGVLAAIWAGGRIGWVGYPLGFIGGIGLSAGAVCGVLALYLQAFPDRPVCRNGTCRSNDYDLRRVGGALYWFCRCGRPYHYEKGRFYEVLQDGTRTPYMINRPFRGWRPDMGNVKESGAPARGDGSRLR